MNVALHVAAALLVLIGIAHSYLGERYLLMRLFRRSDLPRLMGSTEFTTRTLRFAWHITSIAWLGFAALLVIVAHEMATTRAIGLVVCGTFAVHGAIALFGSRGRHYSWIVFFAVALLAFFATRAS